MRDLEPIALKVWASLKDRDLEMTHEEAEAIMGAVHAAYDAGFKRGCRDTAATVAEQMVAQGLRPNIILGPELTED